MLSPWRMLALLPVLVALATTEASAFGTSARVEVPIRQVRLSDGVIRYSVPVSVGGTRLEAMLDTGSFGLRVLARALPPDQYAPTQIQRSLPFASGARLHGVIATAVVGIGGVSTGGPVPIQVVDQVDCVARMPNCAASRVSPSQYGIGGNGLANEGFQAILGLSLRSPHVYMGAANPLASVGTRRWIVILPRPEGGPGVLIINPDPSELVGFRTTHIRERHLDSGSGSEAGIAPFWSNAVLYDANRGTVALRPRQ
jgi:hypothetical protein